MKKSTSKKHVAKKYKLEELMNNVTKCEYSMIRAAIPGIIGKCMNTFNGYKNIPLNSKEEIPNRIVVLLEDFFGLQPRELSNIKIQCEHYKEVIKKYKIPLS